jgi:hypothetical protein
MLDVAVFRGADIYIDQFLFVGSLRLKLKKAYHKKPARKRYDVRCLKIQKE